MTARRTYWHLEGLGRAPTEYELVSSRLLYYPARGFEVATPVAGWYRRHQQGSPLCPAGVDWDGFRDPRETTYRSYVALQQAAEARVDELVRRAGAGHDAALAPVWVAALDDVLPVLRYPVHGLQMAAAYVGHMAPGGRLVIAGALQAADELRRVERLAQRMRALQDGRPAFGAGSKVAWQSTPRWQPWRELIERLLTTYDWGEALVALGLVVKPAFDAHFGERLADAAERHGDHVTAGILGALVDDARWHEAWTAAAVDFVGAAAPATRAVVEEWKARWRPRIDAAIEATRPWFHQDGP